MPSGLFLVVHVQGYRIAERSCRVPATMLAVPALPQLLKGGEPCPFVWLPGTSSGHGCPTTLR